MDQQNMKNKINYIYANQCRLCDSKKIKIILKLDNMPPGDLYSNSYNSSQIEDIPSDIQLCEDCSHIQMSSSVDPKILYSNYLSRPAATNQSLSNIYQDYANEIAILSNNGRVLEIGSNDGLFLQALSRLGIDAVGIEPAFNLHEYAVNSRNVKSINNFFSYELLKEYDLKNLDLIFANHSISNIENIKNIATSVGKSLKENGVFIVQTFYQIDVFKKQLIENYNHEHLSYFTINSLKNLFAFGGLKLFKIRYIDAKGGSIRCYFKKTNIECELDNDSKQLILKENNLNSTILEYAKLTVEYINERRTKIPELVSNLNISREICAYGTSIGATVFTYQFRLNKIINTFFDDDELRQNRYSPGLGIKVLPSNLINAKDNPICIITAPLYANQIIEKNKNYLKEGGKFITFWPEIRVHSL